MNLELSDEHKMIRQNMRDFAEKEVKPHVREYEDGATT